MLDKILEIIKTKPRHYVKIIRSDPELLSWVETHSQISSNNLAAKIYSAVSNTTNICERGSVRRFVSVTQGWGFCGTSSVCECARNSVAEKCRQAADTRDWTQVLNRRRKTNLEKYGHINAAQSTSARIKHREYFENVENKNQALARHQSTMLERYGVTNAAHIDGVQAKKEAVWLERYGVANPQQNPVINRRSQETRKKKYHARYLVETSYQRMKQKFAECGYTLLTAADNYTGVDQKNATQYLFRHDHCGVEFTTYIYSGHRPVCPSCFYRNPSWVSLAEKELADWIESLGVKVVRTERSLISPQHIDIYLPDYKLAIEYCGLYWHAQNSNNKLSDYHRNKYDRCRAVGVDLITVFEDEWQTKQGLIKSILSTRIGIGNRLGARLCQLREVTNREAKTFIDQNHLQSHINATVNLALFHKDQIVSIMSFGRSRYNKNYQWELLRFCTQQGWVILGGAQRLWKYFLDNYQPQSIVSYCDLRWFSGNTYSRLGMTMLNETDPSYWYTDYVSRFHRSAFTKKKLMSLGHDSSKTEKEIMMDLGFDRIWDCGNRVYVFTKGENNQP